MALPPARLTRPPTWKRFAVPAELDDQLLKAQAPATKTAANKTIDELEARRPGARAELSQRRLGLLVDLRRFEEAIALSESLIRGDCAGNFE